jgi:hypothetical protein
MVFACNTYFGNRATDLADANDRRLAGILFIDDV